MGLLRCCGKKANTLNLVASKATIKNLINDKSVTPSTRYDPYPSELRYKWT